MHRISSDDVFAVTPKGKGSVLRWRQMIGRKDIDLRTTAQPSLTQPQKRTGFSSGVIAPIQALPSNAPVRNHIVPGSLQRDVILTRESIIREIEDLDAHDARIHASFALAIEKPRKQAYHTKYFSSELPNEGRALSALVKFASPRNGVAESGSAVLGSAATAKFSAKAQKKERKRARRSLFLYGALALAAVLFFFSFFQKGIGMQDSVFQHGVKAYALLSSARESLERARFDEAADSFRKAREEFENADAEINSMGNGLVAIIAYAPFESRARSGIHMINAGLHFTKGGESLNEAMRIFRSSGSGTDSPFSQTLLSAGSYIREAQQNLWEARADLTFINPDDVPESYRSQFLSLRDTIDTVNTIFGAFFSNMDVILTFLGHDSPRSYLLLFQNPAEIRPTGGFIGTYGLLELSRGEVKNLKIDGIYNADGQLTVNVIPPKPVQHIATAWSMHDANWFFDFPSSAEKIMWFYEKTGGPTTDGVIAFTPNLVERLLEIVGAIDLPQYGYMINSENFRDIIQEHVEVKYDKAENRPKQILADFTPLFLERLNAAFPEKNKEMMKAILQSFQEKDILLYSRDKSVQDFFAENGWGGVVNAPVSSKPNETQDLLAVVHANLGGYKSDRVTKTSQESITSIQQDGSVRRIVRVTRTHEGGKTAYDWYNKPNVDYVRFYVPSGAELVAARGFSPQPPMPPFDYAANDFLSDESILATGLGDKQDNKSRTDIFQENGMKVFGNWMIVRPGDTKTSEIEYTLPGKLQGKSNYSLTAFSQPGIAPAFDVRMEASGQFSLQWCDGGEYKETSFSMRVESFNANKKIECLLGD